MQEYINQFHVYLANISNGNEILAAGVGLWLIGLGTYFLNKIPQFIRFVKSRFIYSVELVLDDMNRLTYMNFMAWYSNSKYINRSRSYRIYDDIRNVQNQVEADSPVISTRPVQSDSSNKVLLAPGSGLHWFWFNKKVFWFSKNEKQTNSAFTVETCIINTFAFSNKSLIELVEKFKPKPINKEKIILLYNNDGNNWHCKSYKSMRKTSVKNYYGNTEVLKSVIQSIKFFQSNRQWYYDNEIAYKLVILLTGEPGTGKTSLIKQIASFFSYDVKELDINSCSDLNFKCLLSDADNSVISIEDIDSNPAVLKRSEEANNSTHTTSKEYNYLTLSGILNCLDGISSLDNSIVFITTNHYEKLDSALIRSRRIDQTYVIEAIEDAEIKRFIKDKFDIEISNKTFCPIKGCDLHQIYIENHDNPKEFISKLKTAMLLKTENEPQLYSVPAAKL